MDTYETAATAIGARLRDARVHAGLSQDQAANLIGRSQGTISKWERGLLPNFKDLYLYAEALGAELGQLLTPAIKSAGQEPDDPRELVRLLSRALGEQS